MLYVAGWLPRKILRVFVPGNVESGRHNGYVLISHLLEDLFFN